MTQGFPGFSCQMEASQSGHEAIGIVIQGKAQAESRRRLVPHPGTVQTMSRIGLDLVLVDGAMTSSL